MAHEITYSCKTGDCASCSGARYDYRMICGQRRLWLVECACDCHEADRRVDEADTYDNEDHRARVVAALNGERV